jgi:hypothetical protein
MRHIKSSPPSWDHWPPTTARTNPPDGGGGNHRSGGEGWGAGAFTLIYPSFLFTTPFHQKKPNILDEGFIAITNSIVVNVIHTWVLLVVFVVEHEHVETVRTLGCCSLRPIRGYCLLHTLEVQFQIGSQGGG